jgi:hypothetical protein
MRLIVAILAVAQAVLVGWLIFKDGFPDWDNSAFFFGLVAVTLPPVVLANLFFDRPSRGGADSLIGLEIEARKAELRKRIGDLKGKDRSSEGD